MRLIFFIAIGSTYGCLKIVFRVNQDSETTTAATTEAVTTIESVVENEKAVLLLNTRYEGKNNVPMVITMSGEVDDDLNFSYGDGTAVEASCAFTLNGEFWVAGGDFWQSGKNYRNKLSKIINCRLTSVGELPFDFPSGACNVFDENGREEAWLCFGRANSANSDLAMKQCKSFDGILFENRTDSAYPHESTYALGSYRNAPFITGGSWSVKTELFNFESNQWLEQADFPGIRNRITYYATVSSSDSVYVIGGARDNRSSHAITRFRNNVWQNVGNLLEWRSSHGAIKYENRVMIIGGEYTYPTEIWDMNSTVTEAINPTLTGRHYAYGNALFIVDKDFCKK